MCCFSLFSNPLNLTCIFTVNWDIMWFQKELLRLTGAFVVIFLMSGWKGRKKWFYFFCYVFTNSCLGEFGKLVLLVPSALGLGCMLVAGVLDAAAVVSGQTSGSSCGLQPPAVPQRWFWSGSCSLIRRCFPLSARCVLGKAVSLEMVS